MLVVGLKLTHDGAVAIIDGTRLVTVVEVEKRAGGRRFARLDDLAVVDEVLAEHGIDAADVDRFVVDGWQLMLETGRDAQPVQLRAAPYHETRLRPDSLAGWDFDGLPVAEKQWPYRSYCHTTSHVMSAYCASPFASAHQPAWVLVWDGAVQPRLYAVDPDGPRVESLGPIFGLLGSVYATFATRFAPFRPEDVGHPPDWQTYHQLTLPGKVMAYTALGQVREDLCEIMDRVYAEELEVSFDFAEAFSQSFLRRAEGLRYAGADAMASLQHWLGQRLLAGLRAARSATPGPGADNLCLSGGCALNIKWNTAIRHSGLFGSCWVPPFPNDSGAALGTACAEMVRSGAVALDWSVYNGPSLGPSGRDVPGWSRRPCSLAELAALLHRGEPVVFLHGRAELGPRALGNRSILAAPTDARTRDRLNAMKGRESYRPVSPVCLEERAAEIFDPGTPDPYMLFEHAVRPGWVDRIPAVIHLDGSARLQTVSRAQNATLATLLDEYERCSGVPVLCNTSANRNGTGFFPDVDAALEWGRCRYVWSDGTLWEHSAGENG